MFQPVHRPPTAMPIQKPYKGFHRIVSVQTEICNIHVRVTNWINKPMLCRLNKSGLFSNKHIRMATMKINLKHSWIQNKLHGVSPHVIFIFAMPYTKMARDNTAHRTCMKQGFSFWTQQMKCHVHISTMLYAEMHDSVWGPYSAQKTNPLSYACVEAGWHSS